MNHITGDKGIPGDSVRVETALSFFTTAGQVSDYAGAAALFNDLPNAQWMLADRGYNAEWFRDAGSSPAFRLEIPLAAHQIRKAPI